MKIAVLAGGLSPERDVSLASGAKIAAALIRNGHKVAFADVYAGVDFSEELFTTVPPEKFEIDKAAPSIEEVIRSHGGRRDEIGEGILDLCKAADVVFLALHGGAGEDGHIQAALDCFGVTYTGSGMRGSLLAMDKELSKTMLAEAGLRVPEGFCASGVKKKEILEKVGLPCVIKPISCGSSVGVSIVEREEDIDAALADVKKHGDRVIVERKISGREFSVGILGGEALPAIEIIPKTGFYDYKNKYSAGMTEEICPADLTAEQATAAAHLAENVFSALKLSGYARVDMMLDSRDGQFYCLEANNLPGMTEMSLLPQEAAAAGIGYDALCEKIVRLALEKR